MRRDDPNREHLLIVADAIGDPRSEVVFVGGSVAGLFVRGNGADTPRAADLGEVIRIFFTSHFEVIMRYYRLKF